MSNSSLLVPPMPLELVGLGALLADHTFRTVLIGTTVIGAVAGALGSFAYLRKQSLMSDLASHAALPGALVAFLLATLGFGTDGRALLVLIIGALVSGTIAVLFANRIAAQSKIRIDTAMAVVLTLFFGLGMLLLRVISDRPIPYKGGVADYLFGNASVITRTDLVTVSIIGAVVLAVLALCWKEFQLGSFDPAFARVLGFSGRVVDLIMFSAIVLSVVIGVKTVGLVLMVAFVVTPPAAARQWTRTLAGMVGLSALIGGFGSAVGAWLSIAADGLPTGPVIVLVLFAGFVFSLLAAPRRSVLVRAVRRSAQRRRLAAALAATEAGE